MSSTASATTTATDRVTCWCHQCDMSVSLVFSSSSTISSSPTISLPCPHCHSLSLEHMDAPPDLISNSHFDFLFADYDFDCYDDGTGDNASNSVTNAWQSSISNLVISESLSGELCVICKDEFFVDSEVNQLPCKHLYHPHCILPWLSHHSSCPLCRFQLISGNE
ncbi:E3 ubiquitin-protein ligase RNF181-like [Mangifera indica]|uniref:E3 ubiquitin-protein ligase RNF181-like n=1 Tax=Mangifera indica TaxID=29780 RepID=UPI001CFB448A|nr:E3 ubiquitin-protein ligase RNF181-like [Mangifera indica]